MLLILSAKKAQTSHPCIITACMPTLKGAIQPSLTSHPFIITACMPTHKGAIQPSLTSHSCIITACMPTLKAFTDSHTGDAAARSGLAVRCSVLVIITAGSIPLQFIVPFSWRVLDEEPVTLVVTPFRWHHQGPCFPSPGTLIPTTLGLLIMSILNESLQPLASSSRLCPF